MLKCRWSTRSPAKSGAAFHNNRPTPRRYVARQQRCRRCRRAESSDQRRARRRSSGPNARYPAIKSRVTSGRFLNVPEENWSEVNLSRAVEITTFARFGVNLWRSQKYEPSKSNADAASVPGTEAATSRHFTVLSSRRFLRTLLRRCGYG